MPNSKIKDREYWKDTIMEINDRKLLNYIRDMVQIRLDHDRAEENMDKTEKKMDNVISSPPMEYEPPRRNLKPLKMSSKMAAAAEDKEEPLY